MVFLLKDKVAESYRTKTFRLQTLTVPRHNPIKVGVMKSIIEQVKTTQEDFIKYLK